MTEQANDGESEFLDQQRDFDLPQGSMANNIGRDPFSHRYGVFDGEEVEEVSYYLPFKSCGGLGFLSKVLC
jgi:hypothetical protein